jgi:hypothetical protein
MLLDPSAEPRSTPLGMMHVPNGKRHALANTYTVNMI